MTTPRKTTARLTSARAREEATSLLARLQSEPGQARQAGQDVSAQFSPAGRDEILRELSKLLPGATPPPAPDALLDLLTNLSEGVRSNTAEEHAGLLFRTATALQRDGDAVAGRLLRRFIHLATDSDGDQGLPIDETALGRIVGRLDRPAPVVANCLELATSSAPRAFLDRWRLCLLPVLLARPPRSPASEEAGRMLAVLAGSRAHDVPGELLLVLPRLVYLASTASRAAFLASEVGKEVSALFPALEGGGATDERPVVPHAQQGAGPEMRGLLVAVRGKVAAAVGDALDEILTDLGGQAPPVGGGPEGDREEIESLRKLLSEAHSKEAELSAALAAAREAAARQGSDPAGPLREELRQMKDSLERTSLERDTLARKLAAEQQETEKWRSEAGRREAEIGGQFTVQRQQDQGRLVTALSRPLRELAEHMEAVLGANQGNNAIRRLGISFDSLQKQLARVLGETDHRRIPRELLARPAQEPSNDEDAH